MADVFMKIVVVGHVDHGKSTLIGRLLHDSGSLSDGQLEELADASRAEDPEWALLLDHLAEERDQERTIESAQAFFVTPKRAYRIIDAPGHKEFLKNMVTGASQADAAALVVDAEAGVCEQTRRHAALLAMLGCRVVVLTVNKMDRVENRRETFEVVASQAGMLLDELGLAARCAIPISAMKGWSLYARASELEWYDGPTLFEALDAIPPPASLAERPLRLPVQDVYEIDGRRLAVGRIESGRLATGESVVALPDGIESKVASIERFGESRTSAEAGESIGLTTEHPGNAGGGPRADLRRGVVLCSADMRPPVAARFEANVFWLSREGCAPGDPLQLRCTTQETGCRIETIARRIDSASLEVIEEDAPRLDATEIGRVVMAADSPMAIEEFVRENALGRFVLAKNEAVCAGGTVSRIPEDASERLQND